MTYINSAKAFEEAKKYLPGGVNSPVRAFANVGTNPLFIDRAEGQYIYDIDGNKYIDYVGSWGPMLLGHAYPKVIEAVTETAKKSTSFGAPCLKETELAKLICSLVDGVDMVRMVNSGTEATMSAIRLARGYTGRNKIIKFEGCYHGHSDSLLIKAGSGALTFGAPSSAGVPADFAKYTITLPYNDNDKLEQVFSEIGEEIACVIVEPVAGNMGVVVPQNGFLERIRSLTSEYGSVFICDEVMTGFRISLSGACGKFGITPDLITFGKIIGGGLPVGAYGGKLEIMNFVSPLGSVYQAGTLSGNPLAMAAGLALMTELKENPYIYDELEKKSEKLEKGIIEAGKKTGIPICVNRQGSMMSVFFTAKKVIDFNTACTSNTDIFAKYFRSMISKGIYIAPSQYEAVFMSNAHSYQDIDYTISAFAETLSNL